MKKRIMLIDDEKDFTELTKTLFEFHGFEPFTENDSEQGLERLLKEEFDVLIVDFMMPKMDGMTLLRQLREAKVFGNKPVFILSAKDLTDEERKELLVNNTHFIPKPFEPRKLVEVVKETLAAS